METNTAKPLGPGPNGDPAPDLELAVSLLVEATGFSRLKAVEFVDAIARYTLRKSESTLPAGWKMPA